MAKVSAPKLKVEEFLRWLWFKSGAYAEIPIAEFSSGGVFAFQIKSGRIDERRPVHWRPSDETFHVYTGPLRGDDLFVGLVIGPSKTEGFTDVCLCLD